MSQATTQASASEPEPHDSRELDTSNVDLKSQPIVVGWEDGPKYLTTERSKAGFTLDLHWNPSRNKAFLKLCTTLVLKDNKGKTHVYLFIPPERIRSLSVGTSQIPVPDDFASSPDHICFRFDLHGPANFIGPKIALRPRDSASGTTLDCIRALATQTTFEVHTAITPRNLPRWKLSRFCDTFKFPNHGVRSIDAHARMTDLYGGRGGRVVEVKTGSDPGKRAETAITPMNSAGQSAGPGIAADEPSPPSYDDLALNPPSYAGDSSGKSSKRRRLDSTGASDIGQSGPSVSEEKGKHPPGELDKPENSLIARFVGDGLDKLSSACTSRLVSNVFKEFDGDRRARLVVPLLSRLQDERIVEILNHLVHTLDPHQLDSLWGYLQELGADRFDAIFLRLYTQLGDKSLQHLGQAPQHVESRSAPARLGEARFSMPLGDANPDPADGGRKNLMELGITALVGQQFRAQLDKTLPKMVREAIEGTEEYEELQLWVEDKVEELKDWFEGQFESVESNVMDFARDLVSDAFDERLEDLDPAFGDLVRRKIREAFGNATIALDLEDD